MYKITVENLFENASVHTAILFAARIQGTCHNTRFMTKNHCNHSILVIDEPVFVFGAGLIRPMIEGTPQPNTGHREQPLYYRKVVIETDDVELTKQWIQKAVGDFEKFNETIENTENDKLLILTWDGDYWEDEYDTPLRKTLYLPGRQFEDISNDLELFLNSRDEYVNLDVPWTRTYMLHGLPGTGKTTLIHALASKFEKNIGFVDFSSKHADDQAIRRAVRKLPKNAFLVIEDIDALFKERKGEETNVTFSGMLNILDGIVKNTGLVIFMTTNFLQKIDDVALKRRVDYYLKFDTMTPDQIEQMFVRFYPMQDAEAFVKRVRHMKLTPCILQKFFVRRLRSQNVIEDVKHLEEISTQEYRVLEDQSSLYM